MMNSMRQTSERHRETIADLQRQIEDLTQQTDEREKLLNTEIAQLNKRLKRAESKCTTEPPLSVLQLSEYFSSRQISSSLLCYTKKACLFYHPSII